MAQNIKNKHKVLIVAPFWGKQNHVGIYRVERFIKWLSSEGYSVVVLKASFKNEIKETKWGLEISVKDGIGKISDFFIRTSTKVKTKVFSYLWYALVLIFSPVDTYFYWSQKVRLSKLLNNYIKNINFIIASSPPSSSLIAAYSISKNHNIPLIVDMRDGWLDEPLISGLKKKGIRKAIEGRLEKNILSHSAKIFLTSSLWGQKITERLPQVKNKITILTNAYPEFDFRTSSSISIFERSSFDIKLLYAGRFTGSSYLRKSDILLRPLFNVLQVRKNPVELLLLSNLKRNYIKSLDSWKSRFEKIGCKLSNIPQVKRRKMFDFIANSSGLLLLSTGQAPLPSKTFEYIKSTKPILAVTPKGSTVWEIGQNLHQMFLYDYTAEKTDLTPVEKFLDACNTGDYKYNIPDEYSEEYLSKIFMDTIKNVEFM